MNSPFPRPLAGEVDRAKARDGEGQPQIFPQFSNGIWRPARLYDNMEAKMTIAPRAHWTTDRARSLRKADNIAEGALWNVLKARQLDGHKFVRQHPIGPYFADFVHRKQKLVIEVDGSQHVESEHDARRDAFLVRLGYSVLRFWSGDVLRNRTAVCDTILSALEGRLDAVSAMDVTFQRAHGPSPSSAARMPPLPQAREE